MASLVVRPEHPTLQVLIYDDSYGANVPCDHGAKSDSGFTKDSTGNVGLAAFVETVNSTGPDRRWPCRAKSSRAGRPMTRIKGWEHIVANMGR